MVGGDIFVGVTSWAVERFYDQRTRVAEMYSGANRIRQ